MIDNLEQFLIEQLKDIYDAEQQALKAIPMMATAISDNDVKKAFTDHAEQTKKQIERLEQIFEKIGEKPERHPCKGMAGLVAESEEHMTDPDPEFRDAMLVGAEQKAEHYEIAAYTQAQEIAELLGNRDAARRLRQNLAEEERMSRKLAQLSSRWAKKTVREEHRTAA